MRRIIYITGITCSGKTTLAKRLSEFLGIPYYSADDVYSMIARELNHERQEELVMPENWKKFYGFGDLKHKYYKQLLSEIKGDFILEGFPLFFKQDRVMVDDVCGKHDKVFFKLKPELDTWIKQSFKKLGNLPVKRDLDLLTGYFEEPEFHYYEIEDIEKLFVIHDKYQRDGFTDKKIEALHLNDLKGKTVLDCGCNAGLIGKHCLESGALSVTGIDNNWRYLEEAKSNGLIPIYMELEDIKNIKEEFDITYCASTLHYISDKEKFIMKIASRTKEYFVLEIPILQEEGRKLGMKNFYFIPTKELVLFWLNKYFNKVEVIGESPAPDDSYRLVFKAYASDS